MAKILIIEDSDDINQLLAEVLTKEGHDCVSAYSGTEGLLHYRNRRFDLILLDLMLPGKSGADVLKEIEGTPVIVLTAVDALDSKVQLLTQGANDYITKPFQIRELIARIGVQLRKTANHKPENLGICVDDDSSNTISYKNLVLDPSGHLAFLNGTELVLTKQEFKILELLLSHPGRAFTKQNIYDYAWEEHYIGEDKTINVHISNIRKKIKSVSDDEYIETVWGIGFRLAK